MKSTNRIKVVTTALRTFDEVRQAVQQTVGLQLRREQLIAERDKALQVIGERYGKQIDEVSAIIDERTALLQQWADAHPEEFGASAVWRSTATGWVGGRGTSGPSPSARSPGRRCSSV